MIDNSRYVRYLERLKGIYKPAVKVSWLRPDESVGFEFTNDLYNMDYSLNVNMQDGARRTCTVTLDNQFGQYPVDFNNIWIGQKFQLWLGVYLDDEETDPYYISQGIFVITNPQEAISPNSTTVTLQGQDKWSLWNGVVYGNLENTYKTTVQTDIRDAATGLARQNRFTFADETIDLTKRLDPKDPVFLHQDMEEAEVPQMTKGGHYIYKEDNNYYIQTIPSGGTTYEWKKLESGDMYEDANYTLPGSSSTNIFTKEQSVYLTPYTSPIELGKTYADILLDFNTMIMGKVYYDRNGYLTFEPLPRNIDDLSNLDKEIDWNFSITEPELNAINIENKFDGVFNDVIVFGGVVNGKQAKGRVQNLDPASACSVDQIGLKTKPPYKEEGYLTDERCVEVAKYYAQTDMALERAGSITTIPIYHLDVDHLITLTTDTNYKEVFLVTGFSLSSSETMSINLTNIKYFVKWTTFTE